MGKTDITKRGVDRRRLTDKQRMYAHEYVIDFNGKRAAKAAGYKLPERSATELADRRRYPLVCDYVAKLQREALGIVNLKREDVLRELAYLALRDIKDLCNEDGQIDLENIGNLPGRIRRCIDSVKVIESTDADGNVKTTHEIKLSPKIKAVELAMKHFGMLAPEEHNVNVKPIGWDGMFEEEQDLPDLVGEAMEASEMVLEEGE